jgi:DNA-binding NtrC family response regulator
MIFDAVSRHRGGELAAASLSAAMGSTVPEPAPERGEGVLFPDGFPTLREADSFLVRTALQRTGGNQARAARLLGISPQALSKRLKSRDS